MVRAQSPGHPRQVTYPVRPGYCSSQASHPSTSPSAWSPDMPTPPERSQWPHPRRSPNPRVPDGAEGHDFKMKEGEGGPYSVQGWTQRGD